MASRSVGSYFYLPPTIHKTTEYTYVKFDSIKMVDMEGGGLMLVITTPHKDDYAFQYHTPYKIHFEGKAEGVDNYRGTICSYQK